MPVTQARDRMAAVEIQNFAAIARVQPDAFAVRDFDRVLRKNLRQVRRVRCCGGIGRCHAQVHPGAGAVRPVVSAKPKRRFIHWTAPPAAPLFKLSTTDMTAMELPFVTALKFA